VIIKEFKLEENKKDYYLYVWRCIPYKKFDLIVDAFNKNWKKLILVTNTDNKLYRELKAKSKENITWELNISREKTAKYFSEARAFLFPPEEDFWLVPIEAQACWTPVIAYWKWWALETVINKKTGIFFENQTVESLNKTIEKFETLDFDPEEIRKQAEKFDKKIFMENLLDFIEEKL
jgi:glycosyltransferase involved in cell wall biosynthesis